MQRQRLETRATGLAVISLGVLVFGGSLAIADETLSWDLFDPGVELFVQLGLWVAFFLFAAGAAASLLVNLSLIALHLERLADQGESDDE